MLNQAFPLFMKSESNRSYILDPQYHNTIVGQNMNTDCGLETRLGDSYTYRIINKLKQLSIHMDSFDNKVIMDICGGAGFLSYHLIKGGIKPKKLVICDISQQELDQAKKIIEPIKGNINIEYCCENILNNHMPKELFDSIIGNSYLHHFYDVPAFLQSIHNIIKPGGLFISTHEPTTPAVAIEAGSIALYIYYLIRGQKYVDDIRYRGDGIKPNNLGDVWIFDNKQLQTVFEDNNFENIIIKNNNIFEGLLSNNYGLFPIKLSMNKYIKKMMITFGFKIDKILSYILPSHLFGELIFCIKKS